MGDIVYSTISYSNTTGSIEPKTRGRVTGPCDSDPYDPQRILIVFDSGCRENMLVFQLDNEVKLPTENASCMKIIFFKYKRISLVLPLSFLW